MHTRFSLRITLSTHTFTTYHIICENYILRAYANIGCKVLNKVGFMFWIVLDKFKWLGAWLSVCLLCSIDNMRSLVKYVDNFNWFAIALNSFGFLNCAKWSLELIYEDSCLSWCKEKHSRVCLWFNFLRLTWYWFSKLCCVAHIFNQLKYFFPTYILVIIHTECRYTMLYNAYIVLCDCALYRFVSIYKHIGLWLCMRNCHFRCKCT